MTATSNPDALSGPPKLLLATGNPGKARELAHLLADVPYDLVTLADLGIPDDVEEDGDDFEANALIKARAYARRSGLTALADDSGLEVDALAGQPGVRSKRYLGEDATDTERNAYLVSQLRHLPREERTARFRCVIAIAAPDGRAVTREGICRGIIEDEPKGSGGFGYDPVFWVPDFGRTMAELTLEEKNRVSHRARAAREAAAVLSDPRRMPHEETRSW